LAKNTAVEQVAFEEQRGRRPVVVGVLMLELELQLAVFEIEVVDRIVGRPRIVEAQVPLTLADGLRALGE
jgi:hypothetical protein